MCCSFHEWINRQKRVFEIDFVPYQAAEAEEIFPGINTLDPAREMIVRTDEGEIFRGRKPGFGVFIAARTIEVLRIDLLGRRCWRWRFGLVACSRRIDTA